MNKTYGVCKEIINIFFYVQEPTADPGVDAATLRKALEWELSLDARDLRSHAWYHGAIPRHRAEEIVQHEGEFLVRDCTSQPGNYVLTCRTKVQPLHFVIIKVRSSRTNISVDRRYKSSSSRYLLNIYIWPQKLTNRSINFKLNQGLQAWLILFLLCIAKICVNQKHISIQCNLNKSSHIFRRITCFFA